MIPTVLDDLFVMVKRNQHILACVLIRDTLCVSLRDADTLYKQLARLNKFVQETSVPTRNNNVSS